MNKTKKKIDKYKLIIIFLILVFLDQITKYILKNKNIDLGILKFTPVQNTGMSFGLLQNSNFMLIIISIIAIILLIKFRKEFENQLLITIILAGITGNLLDRLFKGYVFDFINFQVWPVFNLADTFIVTGVIITLIIELKQTKNEQHKKNIEKNKHN